MERNWFWLIVEFPASGLGRFLLICPDGWGGMSCVGALATDWGNHETGIVATY